MIDLATIRAKRETLKTVADKIAGMYPGVESWIYKFVDKISVWYTMPDLLYKPTVINLVGLTGCGKTSVIRDFFKELDMYKEFFMVDMFNPHKPIDPDSYMRKYDYGSMADAIENRGNVNGGCRILVCDEIHKWKAENSPTKGMFSDYWNLLSDGRISDGVRMIANTAHLKNWVDSRYITPWERWNNYNNVKMSRPQPIVDPSQVKDDPKVTSTGFGFKASLGDDEDSAPKKPHIDPSKDPIPTSEYWSIDTIDKVSMFDKDPVYISEPLFNYHKYSKNSTIQISEVVRLERGVAKGEIKLEDLLRYPGFCYASAISEVSKRGTEVVTRELSRVGGHDPLVLNDLLIINIGNVDKLYEKYVTDTNITPDELYEATKDFNGDDVKDVLLSIFRPEEVSRFGSTYIVASTLPERAFTKIITNKLSLIEVDTLKETGISVKLNNKLLVDSILKNGVVATQGARPVIQHIYDKVSQILPEIIFDAMSNNITEVNDISRYL